MGIEPTPSRLIFFCCFYFTMQIPLFLKTSLRAISTLGCLSRSKVSGLDVTVPWAEARSYIPFILRPGHVVQCDHTGTNGSSYPAPESPIPGRLATLRAGSSRAKTFPETTYLG